MGADLWDAGPVKSFRRSTWRVLAVVGVLAALSLWVLTRKPLALFLVPYGAGMRVIFDWDDLNPIRGLVETAVIWALIVAWEFWKEPGPIEMVLLMVVGYLAIAGGHAIAMLRHPSMQGPSGRETHP